MEKNYLVQLTQNLYRLTLLFPKKEPLRYKMRELADDILANSLRIIYPVRKQEFSNGANQYEYTNNPSKKTENRSRQILEDLEVLDGFFEVAKVQNWVSPNEILKLQEEYSKLKEEFKEPQVEEKIIVENLESQAPKVLSLNLARQAIMSARQQKILEILKEKGRAQVWEIKEVFPEVSKRTLRRDFKNLLKEGIIERIGERNATFYQLNPVVENQQGFS